MCVCLYGSKQCVLAIVVYIIWLAEFTNPSVVSWFLPIANARRSFQKIEISQKLQYSKMSAPSAAKVVVARVGLPSKLYQALVKSVEPIVPQKLQPLWNHAAGIEHI